MNLLRLRRTASESSTELTGQLGLIPVPAPGSLSRLPLCSHTVQRTFGRKNGC